MVKAKPFCIPKREVWQAYKQVKANALGATQIQMPQRPDSPRLGLAYALKSSAAWSVRPLDYESGGWTIRAG